MVPTSNPVVAEFKAAHPFSSIALSPDRQYAATSCKDSLQLFQLSETGLELVRTVITNPYFLKRNNSRNANTSSSNTNNNNNNNNEPLSLRDFAWGGGGAPSPPIHQTTTTNSHTNNNMMNIVSITDVDWSIHNWLAAAGSNGTIVIWNAADLILMTEGTNNNNNKSSSNKPKTNNISPPVAILSQHLHAVHRLGWHPNLPWLLSSSQDGLVLLWEQQQQQQQSPTSPSPSHNNNNNNKNKESNHKFRWFGRSVQDRPHVYRAKFEPRAKFDVKDVVRDISWSPFFSNVFAITTASGSLIAYNRLYPFKSLFKISAHSGDAISLDWHPSQRNILATGGAGASDRSVKIWRIDDELLTMSHRPDDANLERNYGTATSKAESIATNDDSLGSNTAVVSPLVPISQSFGSNKTIGSSRSHPGGQKRMLYKLTISASVTRLRWRPPARTNFVEAQDRHEPMLAVATAPVMGAVGGSGVLALWSYNRPFVPLSVVEGHTEGAVTGFDWLDTPLPKPGDGETPFSRLDSTRRRRRNHWNAEGDASRLPGAASHEVDSILYDNSERGEDDDEPTGIWQHVVSVGRDGRCLIQSFARGDRPISRVPPSCFAVGNLSPFHPGVGSLQVFAISQAVPSGPLNDRLLTGLRQDASTANAPGIFREPPAEPALGLVRNDRALPVGWDVGKRLPQSSPQLVFNVVDQGGLDGNNDPIEKEEGNEAIIVSPEILHLSRYADRYEFYQNEQFPTRESLCMHNASVATELQNPQLAHMWRMIGTMLEGSGMNGLPDPASPCSENMMQFILLPTLQSLLEERADAGDVQTCVALCEMLEIVTANQEPRIPGLDISLVREWYLTYIQLLQSMSLFSEVAYLIKQCKDPFIGDLNRQATTMHESCPHCGKAILQEEQFDPETMTMARRACRSCRKRVGFCFLCHEPVQSLYVWCPGCGHGGHLECALQWFGGLDGVGGEPVRRVCPTGCGHECNALKTLSAFPRTQSLHHLDST